MATQLRVLIVEDSAADAALLLMELRKGGYEPVGQRVETPEEMRKALVEQTWDIIISDYLMPRFNGMEALKLAREIAFELPFIVVSGQLREELAAAVVKAGARDFIVKGSWARLVPSVQRELLMRESKQGADPCVDTSQSFV